MSLQKRKAFRNPDYLKFVRTFPSCLSGIMEADCYALVGYEPTVAHHVRMGGHGGMGLKPSDYRCVPLTDDEHRDLHQRGEKAWWAEKGFDPEKVMVWLMISYLSLSEQTKKMFMVVAPHLDPARYDQLISGLEDLIEEKRRC